MDLGAGEVHIVVPEDLTIAINSDIGVGEFVFDDEATQNDASRQSKAIIEADGGPPETIGVNGHFEDDGVGLQIRAVVGDGPVDVEVDVQVGLGQVRVTTEERN